MAKKKNPIKLDFLDPNVDEEQLNKTEEGDGFSSPLIKSIVNSIDSHKKMVRLAFEEDPAAPNRFGGLYKDKLSLLPDRVIKRISFIDDLVASIVRTRGNQVSAFGYLLQDRFSTGLRIDPKTGGVFENLDPEKKKEIFEKIKKVSKILVTCGYTKKWAEKDKMSLSQFLYLSATNAVRFGRFATEINYIDKNNKREFYSFRPVDPGTIFNAIPHAHEGDSIRRNALKRLEQIRNEKLIPEKIVDSEYDYYQVIEGIPVQAFTEEELIVQNCYPSTDVEFNGYPLTPMDTAIAAITTHINITNHNKLYFQNGRAAKGILVIQSDDVDPSLLQDLKQSFNANINSTMNAHKTPVLRVGTGDMVEWKSIESVQRDAEFQYLSDGVSRVILSAFNMSPEELPGYAHLCLSPDSRVWTPKGISTIGDLVSSDMANGFNVWTGRGWCEAKAFTTGVKKICKTTTSNGITLTTSPEHRFRIVDERGDSAWRQQKDLRVGDVVLINKNPIPGLDSNIPSYNGKILNTNMMEILGWLTGDGSITIRKKGKTRHSKELEFYYHHNKEIDIRERHLAFLRDFGLDPKVVDRQISVAAIERQKRICSFKTVSDIRRSLRLYNTEFVEWLLSLGFASSAERKVLPAFIHGLPVEYRQAFLRGFFSADGSNDNLDTPSITISDPNTREETKLLLLNLGIRTRACEGTSKQIFIKQGQGESYLKERTKEASKLLVKDKLEFHKRIGFLQDHKQPNWRRLQESSAKWDKVSRSIAVALADKIILTLKGHVGRDAVRSALKDNFTLFRVRSNIENIAKKYGVKLPSWFNDYYQESVIGIEGGSDVMEMVDVEVFDDEHAFVVDGIVVHNSRGTASQSLSETGNEYKLEAHRDTGIRPLLAIFEEFLNSRILPLLDEEVAEYCKISLYGLDADSPDKEVTFIEKRQQLYDSMNDTLRQVDRPTIPKEFGGDLPLNPMFRQMLDGYFTVGEILEHFCNRKGASKDPNLAYRKDPFFFQMLMYVQGQQQMQQQQQMAQQQMQMQAQQQNQPQQNQSQQQPQGQPEQKGEDDLNSGIDQLIHSFSKSEQDLPANKRKINTLHQSIVDEVMKKFNKESEEMMAELANAVDGGHRKK